MHHLALQFSMLKILTTELLEEEACRRVFRQSHGVQVLTGILMAEREHVWL